MNKDKFQKLLDLHFINEEMFKGKDIDNLLDKRDDAIFDSLWVHAYKEINQVAKEYTIDSETKKQIDNLREQSFKKTFHLTSNSDVSACVSDDMGLIATSYLIDYENLWLKRMIELYELNIFPCGELDRL